MSEQYKLSHTAAEIDEKLTNAVEIETMTSDDYNALEEIKTNTLYMLTDVEEETLVFDTAPTVDSTNPVTSGGVYTALSDKQNIIGGAASTITDSNLTANRALVSNGSGKVAASSVTATELGYLSGLADNVQNQIYVSAICASEAALKWDGVIGDKEFIVIGIEDGYQIAYVRLAELPETYSMFVNGSGDALPICMQLNEIGEVVSGCAAITPESDGLIVVDGAIFVPYDNYVFEGVIFPKSGVYGLACNLLPMGMDVSIMYTSGIYVMGMPFTETGSDASKYFEQKTVVTETGGDTLTWDGNTEGLVSVAYSSTSGCYKVSDVVLTAEDFANGCSIALNDGSVFPNDASAVQSSFVEDGYGTFDGIIHFVPYDNYSNVNDLLFPEAGIYFYYISDGTTSGYASSLTVPGYTGFPAKAKEEVIKMEHLPEALRFGEVEVETDGGDTLTWDGDTTNTEASVDVYGDGTLMLYFKRVSDRVLTAEDFTNGCTLYTNFGRAETLTGETVQATFDADGNAMTEYFFVCATTTGVEELGIVSNAPGVYFICSQANGMREYISSLTIPGYTGFTTTTTELVKIDPKYLPDGIGGGGSIPDASTATEGAFLRVVDGVWSAVTIPNVEEGLF